MRFSEEELLAFIKVYKNPETPLKFSKGEDLHQEFANELNISRSEAKSLCHKINYLHNMSVF